MDDPVVPLPVVLVPVMLPELPDADEPPLVLSSLELEQPNVASEVEVNETSEMTPTRTLRIEKTILDGRGD